MLTKKDFQLFAEIIANMKQEEQEEKIAWICPILRKSNDRFNEGTFREFISRRNKNEDLKGLRVNKKYLLK